MQRWLIRVPLWLGIMLTLTVGRQPDRIAAGVVQDTPLPVRILNSGFALREVFPDEDPVTAPRRVTAALVIENPNANLASEGLSLDVRLLKSDGMVLRQIRVIVAQLLPSERRNVVVTQSLDPTQADVAAVEASVAQVLRWREVGSVPQPTVQVAPPLGPGDVPGLTVLSVTVAVPGQGLSGIRTPVALATIANPLDAFVDGMVVAAVAFDEAGHIIGGGQRTQALAPSASAEVSVDMVVSPGISAIARVEVTAAYPWIDLGPYEP